MNFAGIAVLTEPDASRAPRIIGCIRCSEDRGGVTHLLPATIAIPHPSLREKSLRFSIRTDVSRNRERVIALFSCSSCCLIYDAIFHELKAFSNDAIEEADRNANRRQRLTVISRFFLIKHALLERSIIFYPLFYPSANFGYLTRFNWGPRMSFAHERYKQFNVRTLAFFADAFSRKFYDARVNFMLIPHRLSTNVATSYYK